MPQRSIAFPLLLILIATGAAFVGLREARSAPGASEARPPEAVLRDLLPDSPPERLAAALREAAERRDERFIGPLTDMLQLAPSGDLHGALLAALHELTGEKLEDSHEPWKDLVRWYGPRTDLKPPPGYLGWKGHLYAQLLDPRFGEFLYDGAPSAIRVEEIVWGGAYVDGIPALVNPPMRPASEASYLVGEDPVFGATLNGDSRAYPLRILDWHEMVDDVVGGRPVALAYCTLCGAGILFDRTVGGATYEFASSGLLFRSNKLMYDRTTKSLWNQLTGEPVVGKLVGKNLRLAVLPVVLTSWSEWKGQHPATKVVDIETGHRRPYEVGAPYGGYFASPATMFPVWQERRELPAKARVFALAIDGHAKAYPLEAIGRAGAVVNDTLAKRPLVVICRGTAARVPLPSVWQQRLRSGGGTGTAAEFADQLSSAQARRALSDDPSLLGMLTPEMLLAMPVETRLSLLTERSSPERRGSEATAGMFSADFRNQVAERGLVGEVRAYDRGGHTFRPGASIDTIVDERGRRWRVAEEELVGPGTERLPRLGAHLAYWFGWVAFHPETELYRDESAPVADPR